MGTIAQKLTYLEDTKTAIGNAIAAKGGSVTGKTFREYATEISNLPSGGGGTPIAVSKDVSDYTSGTSFDIKKQITGVNFPNGVTSIANSSFENMSGITSVTIPSGVTSIGDRVFYGCSGLTSVTIPNGVTSIGGYAFKGCSSLTSLTIPSSVTNIDMYIFENSNVSSIMISDLTAWCNITKNFPFGKTYHLYLNGSEITSLVIPNTLTTIKKYCFSQCISLTSVTIPSGVTKIDIYAFSYCSSLTSITIPSSVTSIGGYAFEGCSGLTSVTIPNSVTSIGGWAFDSTHINTIITENISNYCLITTGDMWINSSYDLYEGNTLVQNITIPNTVTEIPSRKFYKCTSLQSVTIPDTVTKINPFAFSYCSNLSSVTCLATTPPSMASWYTYFDGTDANLVIYVPAASVDTYKAASGWSSYASRIQAIPAE